MIEIFDIFVPMAKRTPKGAHDHKPQPKNVKRGRGISRSEIISAAAFILAALSFIVGTRLSQRSAEIAVRPVLVFEYSDKGWTMRNVGNGPAQDVVVQHSWDEVEWQGPVRVPALPAKGGFDLNWVGHANVRRLGASYSDIEGRPYSSIAIDDRTVTQKGNTLPAWHESAIGKYWNVEPLTSG